MEGTDRRKQNGPNRPNPAGRVNISRGISRHFPGNTAAQLGFPGEFPGGFRAPSQISREMRPGRPRDFGDFPAVHPNSWLVVGGAPPVRPILDGSKKGAKANTYRFFLISIPLHPTPQSISRKDRCDCIFFSLPPPFLPQSPFRPSVLRSFLPALSPPLLSHSFPSSLLLFSPFPPLQ